MLVENQINVLSDEELEHDSREVLKEDKGKIDRDIEELRDWIRRTATSDPSLWIFRGREIT